MSNALRQIIKNRLIFDRIPLNLQPVQFFHIQHGADIPDLVIIKCQDLQHGKFVQYADIFNLVIPEAQISQIFQFSDRGDIRYLILSHPESMKFSHAADSLYAVDFIMDNIQQFESVQYIDRRQIFNLIVRNFQTPQAGKTA